MDELERTERAAIEMIEFFQEECRRQCKPYVEILMKVRALRPQCYMVDGHLMIPIEPPERYSSSAGDHRG